MIATAVSELSTGDRWKTGPAGENTSMSFPQAGVRTNGQTLNDINP